MKVEEMVKELRGPLTANKSIEMRAKAADLLEAQRDVIEACRPIVIAEKHAASGRMPAPGRLERTVKADNALAHLAEVEAR